MNCLIKLYSKPAVELLFKRHLAVTNVTYLDQNWRSVKGLPDNPNKSSALLNGPDYTYLDGRPTPYGMRQFRRMEKQKEYTEKIIKLTKEVDYAVDRHKRLAEEKEREISSILDSKLLEKGKKTLS